MTSNDPNVDQEIEFHLEMLTRRYEADGLDAAAARAKAMSRMGDLRASAGARQSIEQGTAMRRRRNDWWRGWGQDLRNGWRALRRSPGFVAIAIVMLGLGTGASAAIFSVVDGVILRSPFVDVDRVAMLLAPRPDGQLGGVTLERFERLLASPLSTVAGIGVNTNASPIASKVDAPKRTRTVCLSADMPVVMGTHPRMGRWFTRDEARPGAPPVAVVSHTFWQQTLGGDQSAIGRVMVLDQTPVTIIGVMPPGFDGPYPLLYREVWVPYWPTSGAAQPHGCPTAGMFLPLVRLRPGVTAAVAVQELNSVNGSTDLVLQPYADDLVGDLRNPMNALIGAVLAVLLIAFANVTNLGLERLAGRHREVAVKVALGATRARIIRETMAEHLIVAMAGGLAGVGIAFISFDALVGLLPASLPNHDAVALNTRVLGASLALTLAGGVGAGLLAAWHASTTVQGSNLAAGERGQTTRRSATRQVLVTAELALGVLLLVGALLMVRTFLTLRPSEPGFDAAGKHVALIRLPPATASPERLAFTNAMIDRLSGQPGVRAVAATTSVPLRRTISVVQVDIDGTLVPANTGAMTPGYIDMMRIPVVSGRGFTAGDHAGSPRVAVVNEAFVARYFTHSGVVGRMLTVRLAGDQTTVRIVGVIGNIRTFGMDTRTRPYVYMPMAQALTGNAFLMLDVEDRVSGQVASMVRSALDQVRPGLLVDEVERLADEMNAEVARPRLGAWLFGLFAALAVLLAAVGLAATLAWSVTQRRREIGVRMALGATRGHVRGLVVGQTLRMIVIGVMVGLAAAAWSTRLLAGWLYGVEPLDMPTFAACGVLMVVIGLLAAWLPTHRAVRVDPVQTLRGES
jgi:predicted permease